MAISRISDLPQISNEWGTSDQPSAGAPYENMDKSLMEVSWLDDIDLGTYTSKSIRCGTLKDYLVEGLAERNEFNNNTSFYSGITVSGHVGINEDIADDDIGQDYGLIAKGQTNMLMSLDTVTLSAGNVIELQAEKTVVVNSESTVGIAAEEAVSLQSDGMIAADSTTLYFTSSISTVLAAGSQENTRFAVGQTLAESVVPLYAPTPTVFAEEDSTQVVNIDYLNNIYFEAISAKIKDDILAELNQETPDPEPTPVPIAANAIDVFGSSTGKLFELKTFDCELLETQLGTSARYLWPLNSVIENAATAVQNAWTVLSAATALTATSNDQYPAVSGIFSTAQTVTYKTDSFGHKVVETSDSVESVLALRDKFLQAYGSYWYYTIVSGTTLILPANCMYFRAGTKSQTLGSYCKQSLPALSISNVPQFQTGSTTVHINYAGGSGVNVNYSTKKTVQPSANTALYDLNARFLAPPSVQTYTYMVCF